MDSKLHILQHSLGLDQYGETRNRSSETYRNHFVTGPGSSDYDNCMALVADGLMTRRDGSVISGGDDIFRVTPKGTDYVVLNSPQRPPEPKLTRSQRNYQDFKRSECNESFREWMGFKEKPKKYTFY